MTMQERINNYENQINTALEAIDRTPLNAEEFKQLDDLQTEHGVIDRSTIGTSDLDVLNTSQVLVLSLGRPSILHGRGSYHNLRDELKDLEEALEA